MTGFTLWHRVSRRHKWRAVGTSNTSAGAYALMPADTKNGDWIVKPVGDDPNPVRATPERAADMKSDFARTPCVETLRVLPGDL